MGLSGSSVRPGAPARSSCRPSLLSRGARGASSFWATSSKRWDRPRISSRLPPRRPYAPCAETRSGAAAAGPQGTGPQGWLERREARGEKERSQLGALSTFMAQKARARGLHIQREPLPTTETSSHCRLLSIPAKDHRPSRQARSRCYCSGRESCSLCCVSSQSPSQDTPANS